MTEIARDSRAARPSAGPSRPYKFPAFESLRLANGLTLLVAPITKLPLVSVTALIDAGSVCDPAGREGVAQLMAKLLLEGTEASGGAELTERFERLGASVDAYADWDVASVTMTVLSKQLRDAFPIFAEILRTPAFREREVERLKAERLSELLQLRSEPRGLADEVFMRHVYDPTSRYAVPDGGGDASVASIGRDDIRQFFAARVAPGNTTIVVCGDVSVDSARRIVEEALGTWTGGAPTRVVAVDAAARTSRAIFVVQKPDAPQSEIRIGHVGVPRSHADYFAIVVMNSVLGGLFSSRINLNLREVHAYTYGASSGFDWRRQAGPFVVATAVRSDVTAPAVQEVLAEIDRIRAEQIMLSELSLATSYLDGVFPIRFETTASVAAALSTIVVHGLPVDYFDTYREHIRRVSADDVLAAARTHLHPERVQVIAVGDPDTIQSPLAALGVGPLLVEDSSGQPIA